MSCHFLFLSLKINKCLTRKISRWTFPFGTYVYLNSFSSTSSFFFSIKMLKLQNEMIFFFSLYCQHWLKMWTNNIDRDLYQISNIYLKIQTNWWEIFFFFISHVLNLRFLQNLCIWMIIISPNFCLLFLTI